MNIYVTNLASTVSDVELKDLFSKYGNVKNARIIRDYVSKESRGYGFVDMPVKAEAEKAMKELNSFILKGSKLIVSEARSKAYKK